MRKVVVFDFDGTITRKDTLIEFIRFCKSNFSLYKGFLLYMPFLIAYKLRLYPNWKVKQKIFSYFFKGMNYAEFEKLGIKFASIIDLFLRKEQLDKIRIYTQQGACIYVITASIEEWVRPWCIGHGITHILGTQIEIDNEGKITGNFLTRNCYGKEKVNRLLEVEPLRKEYYLLAYGDSRGDKEMLEFADEAFKV